MDDRFYALKAMAIGLTDDGAQAEITLEMHETAPARFYVNPDSLGVLISNLRSLAGESTRRLVASGKAENYNLATLADEAGEVISSQVATDDQGFLSLALQTEDGGLVRVRLASEAARSLQFALTERLPALAPTEASKQVQ